MLIYIHSIYLHHGSPSTFGTENKLGGGAGESHSSGDTAALLGKIQQTPTETNLPVKRLCEFSWGTVGVWCLGRSPDDSMMIHAVREVDDYFTEQPSAAWQYSLRHTGEQQGAVQVIMKRGNSKALKTSPPDLSAHITLWTPTGGVSVVFYTTEV